MQMKLKRTVRDQVDSCLHAGSMRAGNPPQFATAIRKSLSFKSLIGLIAILATAHVEASISSINNRSDIAEGQTVVWNTIGSNGSLVFSPVSLDTRAGVRIRFSKSTSGAMRLKRERTAVGPQLCLNPQDSTTLRLEFERPVAAAGAEVVLANASSGTVTLRAYAPDGRLTLETQKTLVGGEELPSDYMGASADSEQIASMELSTSDGVLEIGNMELLANAIGATPPASSGGREVPSVATQTFSIYMNGSTLTPNADVSVGSRSVATFTLVKGPKHASLFRLFPDGKFTYQPETGFVGQDTFMFQGNGLNGHSVSLPATATINVAWINSAPTFHGGGDQTSKEDAGPQTVPGWATQMSAGSPLNDTIEHLQWIVNTDQPMLFEEQPKILEDGTLCYTAAPHASGVAHVTVNLKNDGGTENGGRDTSPPYEFVINIAAVPQHPVLEPLPEQTIPIGEQMSVRAKATTSDTGQVVIYSLRNAPRGMSIDPVNGQITWTPGTTDTQGTFQVTVTAAMASDEHLADERELRINVVKDDIKPELKAITPLTAAPGTPIKMKIDVLIPGRHVEYFLGTTTPGANLDSGTGVFTWTPGIADANKNNTFLVTAYDLDSGQMAPVTTFTVSVTQAPTTKTEVAVRAPMQHAAMHIAPSHHRRHGRRHRFAQQKQTPRILKPTNPQPVATNAQIGPRSASK
jgi:hypothetical protein